MKKVVHALYQDHVLCGFSRDIPANWPEGHLYAPVRNLVGVTCEACRTAAANIASGERKEARFAEDDWQEREYEQQQLLVGILFSLHHLTGDDGESYPKIFGGIAELIIWHITDETLSNCDNPIGADASTEMVRSLVLFRDKVDAPILAFAGPDNVEERKFLLGALLDKLIVTIRTPSSNAYNAMLIGVRRKE